MKILVILIPLLLFSHVLTAQCSDINSSGWTKTLVRKNIPSEVYDSLMNGERIFVPIKQFRRDGSLQFEGTMLIFKEDKKIIPIQFGPWKNWVDDKLFGVTFFDSCGYVYHDVSYQYLDSTKTIIEKTSMTMIDGKQYRIVTQFWDFEGSSGDYQYIILPSGKRKRHGTQYLYKDGVKINDGEFYMGKRVKVKK